MKSLKNEDFQPFSLRLVSGKCPEIELQYMCVYARDCVPMAIYSNCLCLCLCFFSLSGLSCLYAIFFD